jgi:hypothetical protein
MVIDCEGQIVAVDAYCSGAGGRSIGKARMVLGSTSSMSRIRRDSRPTLGAVAMDRGRQASDPANGRCRHSQSLPGAICPKSLGAEKLQPLSHGLAGGAKARAE